MKISKFLMKINSKTVIKYVDEFIIYPSSYTDETQHTRIFQGVFKQTQS